MSRVNFATNVNTPLELKLGDSDDSFKPDF